MANNLRDIPTDRESGKLTLAVRLGDRGTRGFYVALLVVAAIAWLAVARDYPWALLGLLAFGIIGKPLQALLGGATGRDLVPVLAATGLFEIGYAVLLAVGVAIASADQPPRTRPRNC